MRSETRLKSIICAVIVLFGMGYARAGTWTTIDYPGAKETDVHGINGKNIVGMSTYYADSGIYGFLYDGTNWTTFSYPWKHDTRAYGISGNNIVGEYQDSSSHGFLYNGTSWTTLPLIARGIDGNNVVGYNQLYNITTQSLTTLAYPGANWTQAYGISGNNIVGQYNGDGYHGFLYDMTSGNYTALNYPGALYTEAYGISGSSIVGWYEDNSRHGHGFLYDMTSGNYTALNYPGASNTGAYGISGNNIVGWYESSGTHNFLYKPAPVCSEQVPGDLNGDCVVDFEDFAIMASHWLQRSSVIIAKFNLDTDPNWTTQGQWQFGTPMGMGGLSYGWPDPNAAYTGQNVYGVNLNGDYTVTVGGPYALTIGPFDCINYTTVELSFARWLNTDTADYVQCKVEASNDGSTWQTVWVNSATEPITDNQWQVVEYDISQIAAGHSRVYVRWSYQILSRAYPYSGWNIDDVKLQGLTN